MAWERLGAGVSSTAVGGQAQVDWEAARELYARVVSESRWIVSVCQEITDAIHTGLPELSQLQELRIGTYASAESVLRQLADMARLRQDPAQAAPPAATIEYAREFVRRGVTIDEMISAYHVGHRTFFRRYAARLHAEVSDSMALALGLELGANWTFAYVQALTSSLVARYAGERDRWVRSATALRAETVRALLAGEAVDLDLAAKRLRYELDHEHLAYVVWSVEEAASEDFGALERAALELAYSLGFVSALVVPFGPHFVAAWIGSHEQIPELQGRLGIGSVAGDGMLAAFGTPAQGAAGFAKSHRQAMHAQRVAKLSERRRGTVTRFQDVAVTALASVDPTLARDFVIEELGALARRDDETGHLSSTLRTYLEEHCSPRRTAHRLGVHENTIKDRLKNINEILGRRADERAVELLVAMRLARLTELYSRHG